MTALYTEENMGKISVAVVCRLITQCVDYLLSGSSYMRPAKLAIDYPIEPDHKTSPLFESGETCILLPSIDHPV